MLKVQVIGLGFVGLTLAVFLSRKSDVLGVEISTDKCQLISSGVPPFFEPDLELQLLDALKSSRLRIRETPEWSNSPTVYFVTVGTPIRAGQVDLGYLSGVMHEVAKVAKDEDLVIVRSTVSVGTTREIVLGTLRGRGLRTRVAMAPERTIEGTALKELESLPQLIGGMDQDATRMAKEFFEYHGVKTLLLDSPEAAELAKLAANTFRDLQFAFANELAMLGDKLGINVRQVIQASNLDYPRSKIASPGPAAGPCLEKDPWILANSGKSLGLPMVISEASRQVNEMVPNSSLNTFLSAAGDLPNSPRVLLAGLAFKGNPETDDTRGSLAFPMLAYLSEVLPSGQFFTLDPLVPQAEPLSNNAVHLTNLANEVLPFDVLIVQHSGTSLLRALLAAPHLFSGASILDYWGDFKEQAGPMLQNAKIFVFGGSGDT